MRIKNLIKNKSKIIIEREKDISIYISTESYIYYIERGRDRSRDICIYIQRDRLTCARAAAIISHTQSLKNLSKDRQKKKTNHPEDRPIVHFKRIFRVSLSIPQYE